jgi:hypothetical protein
MAVSSAGIFASLVVVQLQVLIGGPPCGYLCGSATVRWSLREPSRINLVPRLISTFSC